MTGRGTGPVPAAALTGSTPDVALRLLGCTLSSDVGGVETAGAIVEVEYYGAGDPACHAFRGPTDRNRAMFGPAGTLYVYRVYGMHRCANVVAGGVGVGSAVLIRALQPTVGLDAMRERRGIDDERLLCAGPGRLCKALAIDLGANGHSLAGGAVRLLDRVEPPPAVHASTRIGVTRATDRMWRFCITGSPYLSRK